MNGINRRGFLGQAGLGGLHRGTRGGLGALLVGVRDEAATLVYAGRVGTGFSDARLREDWVAGFERSRAGLVGTCARLGIRVVELEPQADLRRALGPLIARNLRPRVVA